MNMTKILSLITAVSMMMCGASIRSSATDTKANNIFYYNSNNTEITVEGDNLSSDRMQQIADYIAKGDEKSTNDVSTCGILCIFGHDLSTSYATETTHNAYTSSPKCLIKKYTVQYCNRSSCDYIKKELTSSYRTAACHG